MPTPRKRRKNKTLPPGLVRVDQPSTRTHGYVARVAHRWLPRTRTHAQGWRPRFKGYFGDHTYGSKTKALAAAKAWLKYVAKHGRPKP
jgi:hypothetical protein